ncbi:hypothetical protein LNQ03_11765 [Klebsiella pneumoniae subsp. pneumoniae]|nr:hypothetical protein [Klebsiella pneumoniae subsp. pneumoniae]
MSRSGWLNCLAKSRGDRGFPHARRNPRQAADPPGGGYGGILTRMIQRDPELTGVGLVILDEFHERSLQARIWPWPCCWTSSRGYVTISSC